jgi:hypothetical protein
LSIESLKQFQQCQWHCWNYFSGVNDPLIHITIDIYNHKIFLPKFSGVSDTMEAISVVLMRPPKWLWQFYLCKISVLSMTLLKFIWHPCNLKETLQVCVSF